MLLVRNAIFKSRLRLYRKTIRQSLKNGQVIVQECDSCETYESCKMRNLLNCAQYIQVNSYDLIILATQYQNAKDSWDKNLLSRILATYIYDVFQNIFNVFRLDRISGANTNNQDVIIQLKTSLKFLSKKRIEIEPYLRKVRNMTLAHKEIDGFNLLNEINQINHERIYSESVAILPYLTILIDCIQKLLAKNHR
jgi:hypothetical protein